MYNSNSSNFHGSIEHFTAQRGIKWLRPRITSRSAPYTIDCIRPVGTTLALTKYLGELGLLNAAQFKLQEVHYQIEYTTSQSTKYCALGWKNENNGWQLCNERWKGCLGRRAITIIPGHPEHLAVFEDYFHYLSCLESMNSRSYTVLVLNDLCFLTAASYYAGYYATVELFLPANRNCRKATREFMTTVPYAVDQSSVYEQDDSMRRYFNASSFVSK